MSKRKNHGHANYKWDALRSGKKGKLKRLLRKRAGQTAGPARQDAGVDSTRGPKLVLVFEGRDAAGKGGTITWITESLNPRSCRGMDLAESTEYSRAKEDTFAHTDKQAPWYVVDADDKSAPA